MPEMCIRDRSEIEERLKKVDVNTLTPIEAMNLLFELAKMAKEG